MKNARPALRSITVNGRFLSQPITGVQRYAYELLSALDILLSTGALEPIPVTVLVPKDAGELPFWSWLRVRKIGHFTGQLWEQFDLPLFARGSLLFTPCGGAPLTDKPQVITIHDAGPFSTPEAYSGVYRNYYKTLQKILSHTAAHVITVSEFSRQELITHLRIPGEKISYTWLSGEHIFRCDADDAVLGKNALSPGRFVFAVGSRIAIKISVGSFRRLRSLRLRTSVSQLQEGRMAMSLPTPHTFRMALRTWVSSLTGNCERFTSTLRASCFHRFTKDSGCHPSKLSQ